jgi:hypothetical protein
MVRATTGGGAVEFVRDRVPELPPWVENGVLLTDQGLGGAEIGYRVTSAGRVIHA